MIITCDVYRRNIFMIKDDKITNDIHGDCKHIKYK